MNNKTPLFTIVIANYNHGEFIEAAIQSILNQSCQNFELLIVDGGSTDGSLEIIKKYADKLSWWVSEKDNGQSHAFNKGFAKAKGEFYLWVNADDLLLPFSLEIAKESINKYPKQKWFVANTIFIDENNKILNCAKGPVWNDFFIKNGVIYVYGPTSIFHKSLFIEVGGFDESLYYTMDTDLWMRFKNNKYKFMRIPKYFWAFRIHKGSKTSHSFSNPPSEDFKTEQHLISKKNNHIYKTSSLYKQRFFKLFTGIFFQSGIDSLKYKGKEINSNKFYL